MRQSANYSANLGTDYYFFKIRYIKSSFPKLRGGQCNLP